MSIPASKNYVALYAHVTMAIIFLVGLWTNPFAAHDRIFLALNIGFFVSLGLSVLYLIGVIREAMKPAHTIEEEIL